MSASVAWLQVLVTAGVPSTVVAIVGWFVHHRVARRLEHLKQELAGTLAARARRAEFLRDQVANLYGPLAFLLEANSRLISANVRIMRAYEEYFSDRNGKGYGEEMTEVIGTANRYGELVVGNNAEALKLLRSQWGWLDNADSEDAGRFIADIARHDVEFSEAKKLPLEFYTTLSNKVEAPVVFRSDFAQRVLRKLQDKQAELSGLTLGHASSLHLERK